jgi:hypothetical protein
MKVRREMAECRATSARSETRVSCERDKQDTRDRHYTKFRKFRTLDFEPSSVSPVALFPPVSRELDIRYSQVGSVPLFR